MTLRGIRRCIGDAQSQARPLTVRDMTKIYSRLDMSKSEDLAYWLALLLCFRALLRKSNVVEQGLALLREDVEVCEWGVLVTVHRTKTIGFRERTLQIPLVKVSNDIFCVWYHLLLLLIQVGHQPDTQLISYKCDDKIVRCTYDWLCTRIRHSYIDVGLESFTSHSLRRGGATAMFDAKFSLIDIKNLGDWKSMSVARYLLRSLDSKIELDMEVSDKLFKV